MRACRFARCWKLHAVERQPLAISEGSRRGASFSGRACGQKHAADHALAREGRQHRLVLFRMEGVGLLHGLGQQDLAIEHGRGIVAGIRRVFNTSTSMVLP